MPARPPQRRPARRPPPRRPPPTRRAIAGRRVAALVAVAGLATAAGAVVLATRPDADEDLVARFAAAWERGDHGAMYAELHSATRRRLSVLEFARAYREAAATATASRVATGPPRSDGEARWRIPVRVATRMFGDVRGTVAVRLEDDGERRAIRWTRSATFPGVPRGARLVRESRLAQRGDILARDGTPLAAGVERTSPLAEVAAAATGALGPIPADRAEALRAEGVPPDAQVGVSGLELAFDSRLRGRPGGELRAGGRVLASRAPRPGGDVRTAISPRVQRAAVEALAGRLGGIVALRPRTGEILAFAGIAFSGLQPPGSTFKIVTLAGALEAGVTKPSEKFPVATSATLEGVELQNANGESCGGTLEQSFAHSCNSVFGPLGARLGAGRLAAVARRFGFNRSLGIPGAATSSLPAGDAIGDDLAVGSTAIGQGRVQATALHMASIAATIGLRGRRPRMRLDLARGDRRAPTTRVISERVARVVDRFMIAVVREGTGTAAAIPGVRVAGKTGTAELKTTQACEPDPADPQACPPQTNDPSDTDAWFAAYAPAGEGRPRVAVGVLLVGAGAGGETAAPAARQVMLAALRR